MSNQLTPTDLMLQARDTAETYLNQSIRIIDSKFGNGYAKAHPELIAGFMKTAASDFHTAILNQKLDDLIAEVRDSFTVSRGNQVTPATSSCACRLSSPAPGQVNDLLQLWVADHPGHTRKQHVFAYDLFKWLERRSIGGIQDDDFLLTLPFCWVYARYAIAKSMDGFSSLLTKRIPPLCGFFVSVIYLPLCFYGWVFWGAYGLAGFCPGLLTRFIRPPVSRMGARFSRNRIQRSMNHE